MSFFRQIFIYLYKNLPRGKIRSEWASDRLNNKKQNTLCGFRKLHLKPPLKFKKNRDWIGKLLPLMSFGILWLRSLCIGLLFFLTSSILSGNILLFSNCEGTWSFRYSCKGKDNRVPIKYCILEFPGIIQYAKVLLLGDLLPLLCLFKSRVFLDNCKINVYLHWIWLASELYQIRIFICSTSSAVLCYCISFLVVLKKIHLMLSMHGKVILHWVSEHMKFNAKYAQIVITSVKSLFMYLFIIPHSSLQFHWACRIIRVPLGQALILETNKKTPPNKKQQQFYSTVKHQWFSEIRILEFKYKTQNYFSAAFQLQE